jgi:tRNA 2-selenouridine synthase
MIVVRGLAGSGKTALLGALAAAGDQVLDLEGLARHRGSAFGHLGAGGPQPSHHEFQRQVRAARATADPGRPLWVEEEGPFIGSVGVPPELQRELLTAPAVELRSPRERRVTRLLADYRECPRDTLCAAIARTRGLEPTVAARAIAAVRAGRTADAIEFVLPAFDSAYRYRMASASGTLLAVVDDDGAATAVLAGRVLVMLSGCNATDSSTPRSR